MKTYVTFRNLLTTCLLLGLALVTGQVGAQSGKMITYTVSAKTADQKNAGTNYPISFRLYGSGGSTDWIKLKGSTGRNETATGEYVMRDLGIIERIDLYVATEKSTATKIFGSISDDWVVDRVEVKRPHPGAEHEMTTSRFLLGRKIEDGKGWGTTDVEILNRPAVVVNAQGQPVSQERTVYVAHFFPNTTNSDRTVMRTRETWTKSNSVGITKTTESEVSAALTVGYEYDSKVAGKFSAEAQMGFAKRYSDAVETVNTSGYTREQDWSYEVPAHSFIFRKLVLKVKDEYTLLVATNGERAFLRQPGAPVTDTGTGAVQQIPQYDRSGNIVPVPFSRLEKEFFPHLDQANMNEVVKYLTNWLKDGWVWHDGAGQPPPNLQPNKPVQQTVNTPPMTTGSTGPVNLITVSQPVTPPAQKQQPLTVNFANSSGGQAFLTRYNSFGQQVGGAQLNALNVVAIQFQSGDKVVVADAQGRILFNQILAQSLAGQQIILQPAAGSQSSSQTPGQLPATSVAPPQTTVSQPPLTKHQQLLQQLQAQQKAAVERVKAQQQEALKKHQELIESIRARQQALLNGLKRP